ncbi:23S rRNA pseudouridine2457 synthase [Dyadobacter jejuensis]|uniref:Pseudouridine synthase n=1 Tax=Dyadobacter jejuensis TaxID=1082580 RepID=A0A316AQQ4_9BACT|nr:pseudouridine synthase [Dyadobacter jejuensis]PWJ59534.1 23S rRNA pseudouridine2457 synthase [Dyadobacter jejuensis]
MSTSNMVAESGFRYFIINKPRNMVSQFKSPDAVGLLGDLDFAFPEGTHAIGRLDADSEGLLLLTTDQRITRLLFQGPISHQRKYMVLVKGEVSEETLNLLRNGIEILVEGPSIYRTVPCLVERVADPTAYYAGFVHEKVYGKATWLLIGNTEGKFRQIRKMVRAAGHPCIRLIRVGIEDLTLSELLPGELRELSGKEFYEGLKIEHP